MKVVAGELGHRPVLFTKARRFAPEGVRILTDLLEKQEFADAASVVLDWDNILEMQPPEVAKPFILVETYVFVYKRRLTVGLRLDVEDLFGRDEAIASDFVEIIRALQEKTKKALADAGVEGR